MTNFANCAEYTDGLLDGKTIGIAGFGHLGSSIAAALAANGFPKERLLISCGGSAATLARAERMGLASCMTDTRTLVSRADFILLAARPQDLPEQLDMFTNYAAQEARREKEESELAREKRRQKAVLEVKKRYGKNALLLSMADSLLSHEGAILAENEADMSDARGHISDVMLDRLRLDHDRLAGMADGVRAIAALPDHTGRVLSEVRRPNGLVIQKVQVPLGLVSIIYESRPNVTSDAAALALKSGNVCVLRSGREAYRTARAIVQALNRAESDSPANRLIMDIEIGGKKEERV